MKLTAWYHIWADGQWREPLGEYVAALEAAGFDGPLHVGVVGALDERVRVLEALPVSVELASTADDGYEAVTLNALRDHATRSPGAVMYAHTKGAATVEPFRDRWRQSMTTRVVERWRDNLARLDGADVVGCHWLTEEKFPGMFGPMTVPAEGSGFFGGNFWMARCGYLRTLPACPPEPRWASESWIGLGNPRVVDLLPGWPHDNRWPELCT